MLNFPIRNKTQFSLRLMFEPAAQVYDIASQSEVVVSLNNDFSSKGIEIDVWDENFISLWVASEVVVWLDGKKLDPLKEI